MARFIRTIALVGLAAVLVAVAGCAPAPEEKAQPKVAPPAVKTAGKLVVGVDLSTPPFAGVDQGKKAGIDIDVAAAMADELGLDVSYVDVKPSDAATALAQGTADVVLSVPFTGSGLTGIALSGTYITDAPSFFVATEGTASIEPSLTLDTLNATKVGAQRESAAFWILQDQMGPDAVDVYDSLRAAIEAVDTGTIQVVAGDALVGAYILRDFPKVHFAGQLEPGLPLAAAVAEQNAPLSDAVRTSLDQLASDGVLDSIRNKWVGGLPALSVPESVPATPTP